MLKQYTSGSQAHRVALTLWQRVSGTSTRLFQEPVLFEVIDFLVLHYQGVALPSYKAVLRVHFLPYGSEVGKPATPKPVSPDMKSV